MDSFWSAQLRARQIEEDTGISLAAQAEMPLDEWSRLIHGKTPVEAALQAIGAQQPPAAPQTAPAVPQAPQDAPQGIDIASLSMADYAALRAEMGIGQGRQEGRGIFHSVGSQSQEYRDAARRQTGRTALSQSNVTPAPSLTGRYLRHDDLIDHRPAAERFNL